MLKKIKNLKKIYAMKTIMKLALVMGFASFAFFANAQTLPTVGGTTTNTVTAGIDSAQIDFVTVGATMPYKTSSASANFEAWEANVKDAFGTTTLSPVPTFTLQWYVDDAPLTGATTDNINLTWNTEGRFELTAKTSILLGGANVGCEDAVSGKIVYVLPKPTVALRPTSNGHQMVLPCSTTSHPVSFVARGIGQRSVTYTVLRRPLSGTADPADEVTSSLVGSPQNNETWFTSLTSFTAAEALYSDASEIISINITGLEPGYVYTVEITGVSDQISRKSKVGTNNDGFVAPPSSVFAAFAVLPTPTSTRIEHVTNVGH